MGLLYGQYFEQILQHNLSVSAKSASERYAFAPFCHCIGRVLINFLRLVFELVEGWSIENSPRLVKGWATSGWLFFFKKEHFLLDSLFSLHVPKLFKTVYQARGFLGARGSKGLYTRWLSPARLPAAYIKIHIIVHAMACGYIYKSI